MRKKLILNCESEILKCQKTLICTKSLAFYLNISVLRKTKEDTALIKQEQDAFLKSLENQKRLLKIKNRNTKTLKIQ